MLLQIRFFLLDLGADAAVPFFNTSAVSPIIISFFFSLSSQVSKDANFGSTGSDIINKTKSMPRFLVLFALRFQRSWFS